jgi:glycosyltransferase involved in cell wall biosynthesis
VITPAAATTKHLIEVVGVPAEKVTTIPNAVDLAMFTAVRSGASFRRQYGLDDAFVVLAPGRLAAQKDHASLFGAFRFLLSTQYESRLVIAGTGPLEGNLKSSVADLRDRVVFTGDLDRRAMADAMAAADCVCLSSRFEGMPNVLLEAMASGKPCVSSATDGAGEVIRHGVDGFVTAIGNSHAMGSALATLAADSGLRRSMGIAARSRAEAEYAIPTNVARHENVYKEAAFGQEGPVA